MIDALKARITEAMKARRTVERDILRVALGELQNHENRTGAPPPAEEAQRIIMKLIKSNQESIALTPSAETRAKLEEENQVLATLLPRTLGVAEIAAALAPIAAELRAAKGEGPATGQAMKFLKTLGASVEGKDVGEAVKQVRAG